MNMVECEVGEGSIERETARLVYLSLEGRVLQTDPEVLVANLDN